MQAKEIGSSHEEAAPLSLLPPPPPPLDDDDDDSTTEEQDISAVSTLSKMSSNVSKLTDIDGELFEFLNVLSVAIPCLQYLHRYQF